MPGSITPQEFQALADLPLDESRCSRLEPYKELILRWRRQGRSHRRIARLLLDKCKVRVSGEAVRKFVKLRSRPRKPQSDIDLEPMTVQPVGQVSPSGKRLSAEERAEQLELIRSLRDKPVVKEQQQRWNFDADGVTYKPKGDE
jgi:hypothetical protein